MFGLSLRDNARVSAIIYLVLNVVILYISTFDMKKLEYYLSERSPSEGCKINNNRIFNIQYTNNYRMHVN